MMDHPYVFYENTLAQYKKHEPIDTGILRKFLLDCDALYAKGDRTPLTDEEYDTLHQIYISLTGKFFVEI